MRNIAECLATDLEELLELETSANRHDGTAGHRLPRRARVDALHAFRRARRELSVRAPGADDVDLTGKRAARIYDLLLSEPPSP
jgi:hypothetical protein